MELVVPDWRGALEKLMTARPFQDVRRDDKGERIAATFHLPVAGKRTDDKPDKSDYSQFFGRDSLLSLLLFNGSDFGPSLGITRDELLRQTLVFLAAYQGTKPAATKGEKPEQRGTSEEVGKILHQVPGVPLRGYNTLYAACDTTLLFLISGERYVRSSAFDNETWEYLVPRMMAALGYVRAHLTNGLFEECPSFSGAKDFALWATYWRDYGLPGRRGRRLQYPARFLLVQAQVIAALRAAITLTKEKLLPAELERLLGELKAARKAFLTSFGESAAPPVAIDEKGPISFTCTDLAHALYYLEPGDVSYPYLCGVKDALGELQTPWGWRTWKRDPKIPGMQWQPTGTRKAKRHWDYERIWFWEHAFIAQGCEKHGVYLPREAPLLPAQFLTVTHVPFAEFIELRNRKPVPAGCDIQQWTLGYWAWIERQMALR